MGSHFPRTLPILILMAIFVAGISCARSNRTNPETEPLFVDTAELDLGTQYETPAFRHRFHIRDVTNAPVTVQRLESTCDCFRLSPNGTFTIPGGASG